MNAGWLVFDLGGCAVTAGPIVSVNGFFRPVASPGIVTESPAAGDAPKCALQATAGLIHAFSTAPRASYIGGAVGKGWTSPAAPVC